MGVFNTVDLAVMAVILFSVAMVQLDRSSSVLNLLKNRLLPKVVDHLLLLSFATAANLIAYQNFNVAVSQFNYTRALEKCIFFLKCIFSFWVRASRSLKTT
jgi:hypothetical protein